MGPGRQQPGSLGPAPNQSAASRTAAEEAAERALEAARGDWPAWEIRETFGGFLATPAGAPVVQAIGLDDLVRKLREQG
jgi:hypothetical protein